MENLILAATNKTPNVQFNAETGILAIAGKSITENAFNFYQPLHVWIDNYCLQPTPKITFNIILEYINTSSSKYLLDILRKLELLHKSGKSKVDVVWHYQFGDDDLKEAGQDYNALVELPFTMKKI